jgi:Ca2+-dependent lipid-binding protein
MKNLFDEIAYDAKFVKGHKLQPAWYKAVKIFILLAVLTGFIWLFGWGRAIVFVGVFLLLSLIVHMVYRVNTRKFTRNWMDFVIIEDKEKNRRQGIGAMYYAWIILNVVTAFFISGVLTG